ncbi:MAG: glutamate synthase subunit beta [Verrucomicrobia bacterium]|jgi:glutamate synthase (NADPH) small chain|nr:glutamate synthase subunit beta [Verrucomicrobiota bacterium]
MRHRERGFIEVSREDPGYRPKDERVKDYRAVEVRLSDADLREQAARCMDCGIPFCQSANSSVGCPVVNVIPEFNDQVYHGKWREALELLTEGSCFPEFTGRVCPAPCEASCVCGINTDAVTIRQIELTIIEHGFSRGYVDPRIPEVRRDERVAVVGSGPAGLAAAHKLNQSGFNVVVYEADQYPGGMLRYGIPDFKLEKWVVERRVELLEKEGVVFETGVEVGVDVSAHYLNKRFDAILLAGGARGPRDLSAEGRELAGIEFAMDFLSQQNMRNGSEDVSHLEAISAKGKRVVVIGGGDTGSDCVGTSIRQGAVSVQQFEIMPKPPMERPESTPWPLWPNKMRTSSSHLEGCKRQWSVTTNTFTGEDRVVTGLECAEVKWVLSEPGGRPVPKVVEGSEFAVEADLVLLAMGFVSPGHTQLLDDLGVDFNERGFVTRHPENATSVPGVFVAGDITDGPSLVVRAMQDGKNAAKGITAFLGC